MIRSTVNRTALATAATCVLMGAFGVAPASAVVSSNPAPIAIPELGGAATPYPSDIVVAGLGTSITDVNVKLKQYGHTWPADVDVLLEGPTGQTVLLMSDAPQNAPGCNDHVTGLDLTFDDSSVNIPVSATLVSGTYRPTDYDSTDCGDLGPLGDPFPPPAPAGAPGVALSDFNGTNPNGTWRLWVVDDFAGDSGSIAQGWEIDIIAPLPQPGGATCGGLPTTIAGTAGDDNLYGTGGPDRITGGDGNDSIYGFAGNDRLCGEGGDDNLYGGADNDGLIGGSGTDLCYGQAGTDQHGGGCESVYGIP
jgi:Ca2+-binding RTX toxin-like protein